MHDLHFKVKEKAAAEAKSEVHRSIKSFFEQRFGRELKIPCTTRVIYRVEKAKDFLKDISLNRMLLHSGAVAVFDGHDLILLDDDNEGLLDEKRPVPSIENTGRDTNGPLNEPRPLKIINCIAYDCETSKDAVFSIVGITESSIYLLSMFGIRYTRIHIYNWLTSLEDTEILENISRHSIIPLRLPSFCFVLTIGAVDGKRRPHEQVIRVKVRHISGTHR